VALGDMEACKLVLQYSLSKPAAHKVGIAAELEQVENVSLIKRIKQNEKDSEIFDFEIPGLY
jgi:hypothetical protein